MDVLPENVVVLDMSDEEGDDPAPEMVAITRRTWSAAASSSTPSPVTMSVPSSGLQQQLQIQASKRKTMPPLQELYSMRLPSQVVGPALKAMESVPSSKGSIPLTPHTTITAVKPTQSKSVPTSQAPTRPAGVPPLRSVSSKPVDQLQVQVFGRRRKIMNIPQRKRLKNFRRDIGGSDGFHASSSKAAALEDDGWEELENNSDDGGECEDGAGGGNSLSPNSKKKPGPKGPRMKETPSGKFLFKLLEEHGVYDESGNKLYQCEICSSLYIKSFSLKRHYLRTHINYQFLTEQDMLNCNIPRDNDETNNPRGEIVDGVLRGVYKCHVCFDLFDTVPDLKDHLRTHASDGQAKNSLVKKPEPQLPPPPSSTPTPTATKEVAPVITIRKFTPEAPFLPPPHAVQQRYPPVPPGFLSAAPPGMIFPPGISIFPRGGPAPGTPLPNLTPMNMMPSPAAAAAAAMMGSPVNPFFVPQPAGTPPGINMVALNAMRFMSPGGMETPRFPPMPPPNVQISPAIPPGFMASFPPNVSCVPSPMHPPSSMASTRPSERRSSTPVTSKPSTMPASLPMKHGTSGGTLKVHQGAAAQKKMPALLSAAPVMEGGKTYPCDECGKVFPNQKSLQRHCEAAHGLFGCKTCGMEFIQRLDLVTHVRTAHEERPPSTGRPSLSRGGKRADEPEEDAEPGCSREKIHIPGLDSELSLSAEVSITRVLKPGSQAAQQQQPQQPKAVSSVLQQRATKPQQPLVPPQPCISISKITRLTGGVASAVHADSKTSAHLQALRASPEIIVSPIPAGGSRDKTFGTSKLAVPRASPSSAGSQMKKNPEFQYTCLACGAAFSAYKEMLVHQEKVHGNPNVTVFRNRQPGTSGASKLPTSKSSSLRTVPPSRCVLSGTTITATGGGVKPSTSEIVAEIRKEMQNNAARNAAVAAAAAAAVANVSGIQITTIKRAVPQKPASPVTVKSVPKKPGNGDEMADLGIAALFASTSVGGSTIPNAAQAQKKAEVLKKPEPGKKASQPLNLPGPSTSQAALSPLPEELPLPTGSIKAFDQRLVDSGDTDYYSRVSHNIADNLLNHVDGRVNGKRKSRKVIPYTSVPNPSQPPARSSVAHTKKNDKQKVKSSQGFKFDPSVFKDEAETRLGNSEDDFFKALGLIRTLPKDARTPSFEEAQREAYKNEEPSAWKTFAGELTKPKVFMCLLCGEQKMQLQQMTDHKETCHASFPRPVQHLEWDGRERIPDELLPRVPQRASVAGFDCLESVFDDVSETPTCTGCGWVGDSMDELHVHVLRCAEDNGTSKKASRPRVALRSRSVSMSKLKRHSKISRSVARASPASPVKFQNVRVIKNVVEPYPGAYVGAKRTRSVTSASSTRRTHSAGPSGVKTSPSKGRSPAKTSAVPVTKSLPEPQPSTSAQALLASSPETVRQPSPQPGPSTSMDGSSNGAVAGGGLKFIIRHGKIYSSTEATKESTSANEHETAPSNAGETTPPIVRQEVIIKKRLSTPQTPTEMATAEAPQVDELPVEIDATVVVPEEPLAASAEQPSVPEVTIKSKKKKPKPQLPASAEAAEESDSNVSKASNEEMALQGSRKRKSAPVTVSGPTRKTKEAKLEVLPAPEEPQETEFVCQGCGAIFPNKSATDRHSRKCPRVSKTAGMEKAGSSASSEPETVQEPEEEEDFPCPYCPEKFQDMDLSLEHAEGCEANPKNVIDRTVALEPEVEAETTLDESVAETTLEESAAETTTEEAVPEEQPEVGDGSGLMKPPSAPPARVVKKRRRRVSQWVRGIIGTTKKKRKVVVAAAPEVDAPVEEPVVEEAESTPVEETEAVPSEIEVEEEVDVPAVREPVVSAVVEDKSKLSPAPARKSSRISNKKAEQEKEKLETALKLAGEEGSCPTCGQVATAPGWMARHRNVCEGPPVVAVSPDVSVTPAAEEEPASSVAEEALLATPTARPSRKRGSIVNTTEATPEATPKAPPKVEIDPETASVEEIVESFQLNNVDIVFTDKDFKTLKDYSLYQKHVRPMVAKANPKTSSQKILMLVAAKYREFLKNIPKEEDTPPAPLAELPEAVPEVPEEAKRLSEEPTVPEVLEFLDLNDVKLTYTEKEYRTLQNYTLYQKHVRPIIAKANPKIPPQIIMILVAAKYREFLKDVPKEEEEKIVPVAREETPEEPKEVAKEEKKVPEKPSPVKVVANAKPGIIYSPGLCLICRRQMTHAHNLSRHYRTIHNLQKAPSLEEASKIRVEEGYESYEDEKEEDVDPSTNQSTDSVEEQPPAKKLKPDSPKPTVTVQKRPSQVGEGEKALEPSSAPPTPSVAKAKKKKKTSDGNPSPAPPTPVNEPAKTTLSVTRKTVAVNDFQEKESTEPKTPPTTMITLQIHRKPKVAPPPSPVLEVQPGEKSAIISRKKSITLESGHSSRASSVEPPVDQSATQILAVTRIKKSASKSSLVDEPVSKPGPEKSAGFVCQKCFVSFKKPVDLLWHLCRANAHGDGDDDSKPGPKNDEASKKTRGSEKNNVRRSASNASAAAAADKNAKTAGVDVGQSSESLEAAVDEVIEDELVVVDEDNERPPSESMEDQPEASSQDSLCCHVCGSNFTCRGWFNQHVQRCHSVNTTAEELATLVAPGETLVVVDEINCCDLCGAEFSCASKFEFHRRNCVVDEDGGDGQMVDEVEGNGEAGDCLEDEGFMVVEDIDDEDDEVHVVSDEEKRPSDSPTYEEDLSPASSMEVTDFRGTLASSCPACGMELRSHHEGLIHGLCHLIVAKTVAEFASEESLFAYYCKCGIDKEEFLGKFMKYFDEFVETEALMEREVDNFREYIHSRPLEQIQVHFVHLEHNSVSPSPGDEPGDTSFVLIDEDNDDDLDCVLLDSSPASSHGVESCSSTVGTSNIKSLGVANSSAAWEVQGRNAKTFVEASEKAVDHPQVQSLTDVPSKQPKADNVAEKPSLDAVGEKMQDGVRKTEETTNVLGIVPLSLPPKEELTSLEMDAAEADDDAASASSSGSSVTSYDSSSALGAVIETMQLMTTAALVGFDSESESLKEIQNAMGATDEEMAMIQRLGESIGTDFGLDGFVEDGLGNDYWTDVGVNGHEGSDGGNGFYSTAETLLDLDANRIARFVPDGRSVTSMETDCRTVGVGGVLGIAGSPLPMLKLQKSGLEALKVGSKCEKSHGCPKCSKNFPRQISLSLHIIQAHLGPAARGRLKLENSRLSGSVTSEEISASKENLGGTKKFFKRKLGNALNGLIGKLDSKKRDLNVNLVNVLMDELCLFPCEAEHLKLYDSSKLSPSELETLKNEADLSLAKRPFPCRFCPNVRVSNLDVLRLHLRHIHRVSEEEVESCVGDVVIREITDRVEQQEPVPNPVKTEPQGQLQDSKETNGKHHCKWCGLSYETPKLLNLHISWSHEKVHKLRSIKNEDIFVLTENAAAAVEGTSLERDVVQCPICDEHCAGYHVVRHVKSCHSDWTVESFAKGGNDSFKLTKMLGKQLVTLEVTTTADLNGSDAGEVREAGDISAPTDVAVDPEVAPESRRNSDKDPSHVRKMEPSVENTAQKGRGKSCALEGEKEEASSNNLQQKSAMPDSAPAATPSARKAGLKRLASSGADVRKNGQGLSRKETSSSVQNAYVAPSPPSPAPGVALVASALTSRRSPPHGATPAAALVNPDQEKAMALEAIAALTCKPVKIEDQLDSGIEKRTVDEKPSPALESRVRTRRRAPIVVDMLSPSAKVKRTRSGALGDVNDKLCSGFRKKRRVTSAAEK